jgi:methyl-accepting chemotaxis protein
MLDALAKKQLIEALDRISDNVASVTDMLQSIDEALREGNKVSAELSRALGRCAELLDNELG